MRTTHETPTSRFAPAVALAVALTAAPAVWAQTTAQDSAAHRTWNVPGGAPAPTTSTTPTTPTTPTTTAGVPQAAAQGVGDTAFVRQVRTANLLEIRLGNLAAKRSTNAAVKQFAQRMVTDHTTMGNEWAALANQLRLVTTTALDATQQQQYSFLSSVVAPADFDRQYMSTMVQSHQNLIATFQQLGPSAQQPMLRQLAAKGLPTLQEHLTMAQQVANQVGAAVATTTPTGLPQRTSTGQIVKNNGANNARLGSSDEQYVREVSQDHQMMVELAQLAQQKARDSKVKQFAGNLLSDFRNYRDRWTDLAGKSGVSLSQHLGPKHQDKLDRLKQASGNQADRVYLDIVRENLASVVPYFEKEGQQVKSSAVRNLVNQELPTIRQHLARAEALQRQVTTASAQLNRNDRDKDKGKDKDKNKSASNR